MIWHASIGAARRPGVVRVCMVGNIRRVWINREESPARRQLNRENAFWSSETGVAPSCASLFILHAQAIPGSYSPNFPISATALTFTVNRYWGLVPNLSGHANAYRWRSLLKIHWHRASSPQGSSRPFQVTQWAEFLLLVCSGYV